MGLARGPRRAGGRGAVVGPGAAGVLVGGGRRDGRRLGRLPPASMPEAHGSGWGATIDRRRKNNEGPCSKKRMSILFMSVIQLSVVIIL